MAEIWLLIVLVTGAICLGAELCLQALVRKYRKRFQWLVLREDEKPDFSDALITKYAETSFDPVLGWARKPGTEGIDRSPDGDARFKIAPDGSRHNPLFGNRPGRIAVYGDSYAFCRLVDDHETWPYYLSERLSEPVSNFGVGNYGLDQAIIRYRGHEQAVDCDTVIMAIVPETILRIHSQWKHFFEYGNILAFKPVFRLFGDGLKQIPVPIRSIKDFERIDSIIDSLKISDPFYCEKFWRDALEAPFVWSARRNPRRLLAVLRNLVFGGEDGWTRAFEAVLDDNHRFQKIYYSSNLKLKLLEKLVETFASDCRERGQSPILVVLPQPRDLTDGLAGCAGYQSAFRRFENYLPVLDLMPLFASKASQYPVYKSGILGAHTSARMNSDIASYIQCHLE